MKLVDLRAKCKSVFAPVPLTLSFICSMFFAGEQQKVIHSFAKNKFHIKLSASIFALIHMMTNSVLLHGILFPNSLTKQSNYCWIIQYGIVRAMMNESRRCFRNLFE